MKYGSKGCALRLCARLAYGLRYGSGNNKVRISLENSKETMKISLIIKMNGDVTICGFEGLDEMGSV